MVARICALFSNFIYLNFFLSLGAPYFKRKAEDVLVIEKRTSKLEVELYSVPKAQVTWLKDGKELKKDDRIQLNDAKGMNHFSHKLFNPN